MTHLWRIANRSSPGINSDLKMIDGRSRIEVTSPHCRLIQLPTLQMNRCSAVVGWMAQFTARPDRSCWNITAHLGCPTGTARMTPAFNLSARGINHIIHTVGPVWRRAVDTLAQAKMKNRVITGRMRRWRPVTSSALELRASTKIPASRFPRSARVHTVSPSGVQR